MKPGPTSGLESNNVVWPDFSRASENDRMTDVLKGVYNITPTPFRDDGTLDRESLQKLTRFTRAKGVDGMTILGVLGEADKLTERERDEVITATIEAAGPSFPICVGTTHAGTDGCIAYSRRAQELGAAALMIAPPRLARTNDAALRKHYLAVAAAVDIPIVVQDFPPAVGGITMSIELIAGLAAASPKLVHLKLEDDPSPMKVSQILRRRRSIRWRRRLTARDFSFGVRSSSAAIGPRCT